MAKAKSVYSLSRTPGIDRLDPHQIALKLQQAGITQDTLILVYHLSTTDLKLLGELLESAGHIGILPPDEKCIPLIQLLRPNLSTEPPGYQRVPLALELLFPIMYPRHSLVGLNHQVLVDCQETRLVCMAF